MFDFSFSFSSFIAVIKLVNMSDHYRLCVATDCRARLPAIKYDRHTKCPECIGKVCGAGNRCDECSTWSEEQFASFIKHKKKLKSDRERKAKYRAAKRDHDSLSLRPNSETGSVLSLSVNDSLVEFSPST